MLLVVKGQWIISFLATKLSAIMRLFVEEVEPGLNFQGKLFNAIWLTPELQIQSIYKIIIQ